MNVDQTDIYRLLVSRERRLDGQFRTAYGPYDDPSSARDWGSGLKLPTKQEKQVLMATAFCEGFGERAAELEWVTIKTTYTNGGEDVDWDA